MHCRLPPRSTTVVSTGTVYFPTVASNRYESPGAARYGARSNVPCSPVLNVTMTVHQFGLSVTCTDAVTLGVVVVVVAIVVAVVGGGAVVAIGTIVGVPVIGGVVAGSVATVKDSGTVVVVVAIVVVEVCATGRAAAAPCFA